MAHNEKGFTLLEVVASLAIISIILLSFSGIFISAKKTANTNIEKLVVVNLADAYLERLKIEGLAPPSEIISNLTVIKNETLTLNDRHYNITVEAFPSTTLEQKSNMTNIVVTVSSDSFTAKGVVEGYVTYK